MSTKLERAQQRRDKYFEFWTRRLTDLGCDKKHAVNWLHRHYPQQPLEKCIRCGNVYTPDLGLKVPEVPSSKLIHHCSRDCQLAVQAANKKKVQRQRAKGQSPPRKQGELF